MSRLLITLVGGLLASCSFVSPYPPVALEAGDACWNRVDDDLDGLVDCEDARFCADTDACREEGALACGDEIDNDRDGATDCEDEGCGGSCRERCFDAQDRDLDGLADLDDPSCWPITRPELGRCASAAASTFAWTFSEVAGGEVPGSSGSWYTTGALFAFSDGPGIGLWAFDDDGVGVTGTRDTFPVRAADSELSIDIGAYGTDTTRVWIGLVPAGFAPEGSRPLAGADEADVALDLDFAGGVATARARGATSTALLALDGAMTVRIRLEGGIVRTSVAGSTGAPVEPAPFGVGDLPGEWRLVVWIQGIVRLDRAQYSTGATNPCNQLVPQLPAGRPFGDPEGIRDLGLSVAMVRGADGYCVLAIGCEDGDLLEVRSVSTWYSPDGVWWEERPSPHVRGSGRSAGAAGLAWDHETGRYHVAIAEADDDGRDPRARIVLRTGTACGEWSEEPPTPAEGLGELPLDGSLVCRDRRSSASLSYVVRRRVAGGPLLHELWMVGPLGRAAERGLARATSTDGGRTFALDLLPDGEHPVAPPVTVLSVGPRDLVRLRPAGAEVLVPGLVLEAALDDEGLDWARVGAADLALVPATGLAGTFDSDEILSGSLVPYLDRELLVVYSARGEYVPRARDGIGYASVGTARLRLDALGAE